MFWIALSALIMSLTGTGDDTYVIRKFIERAEDAVERHVDDAGRRRAATGTLERTSQAFERHRRRVGKISACVERADRAYGASAADYERGMIDVAPAWDAAADELIGLERSLRDSLTADELSAVRAAAERD